MATEKEMSLQAKGERGAKTRKKPRSPWDKEGKFRYLHRRLNQIRDEVREGMQRIETKLNVLTRTMAPFMEFKESYIIQVVCKDERDQGLLDYLISKGDLGITPTEAAEELKRFKFKPFHITRRIQRMNRRLQQELGKNVAESHNRRWMVTSFVLKAWSTDKEGVEGETE